MEVRQMATAFLLNNNKVLMMKKSESQFYNGEFWSGLGGHLEPKELNSPKEACLREIYEESGITATDIADIKLKYIQLRIKEDEIRQQFVYFGKTDSKEVIPSEEGELHWVNIQELRKLHMSSIIHFMLNRYIQNPNVEEVIVGTITIDHNQEPKIQWAELKDPLIF